MKTSAPATGTCKWVSRLNQLGYGVITINGEEYQMVRVQGGFNLHKLSSGASYRLTRWQHRSKGEILECNCPDAEYNRENQCDCKHVRATNALLKQLG